MGFRTGDFEEDARSFDYSSNYTMFVLGLSGNTFAFFRVLRKAEILADEATTLGTACFSIEDLRTKHETTCFKPRLLETLAISLLLVSPSPVGGFVL